jgi:hypothetical protein
MRLARSITAILVAALMLALLAACGGGSTSAGGGGSLPLFAGAKPLAGSSPMAIAIDAAKQQLKQQQTGADTTVDAYTLPAGASFDQVKKYYNDSLTSAGWKDAAGGAAMPAMPNGGTAVWSKNDNEVFTLLVMPDPTGGSEAIMLVAHATKK